MTLPRVGTGRRSSATASSGGDRQKVGRRASGLARSGQCTMFPALASIDKLLQEDDKNFEQRQMQIQQAAGELTKNCTSNLGADDDDDQMLMNMPTSSPYHIMLLGRTFRERKLQEVVDCLVDALGMDAIEALQKATAAHDATTLVISTCQDFKEAYEMFRCLRSKGLQVQLTSDSGLPTRPRASPTAAAKNQLEDEEEEEQQLLPTRPRANRTRKTVHDLFDQANPRTREMPRRRRSGLLDQARTGEGFFQGDDVFSDDDSPSKRAFTSPRMSRDESYTPRTSRRGSSKEESSVGPRMTSKQGVLGPPASESMLSPRKPDREESSKVLNSSMNVIRALDAMQAEVREGVAMQSMNMPSGGYDVADSSREQGEEANMKACLAPVHGPDQPNVDRRPSMDGAAKDDADSERYEVTAAKEDASAVLHFLAFGDVFFTTSEGPKSDEATSSKKRQSDEQQKTLYESVGSIGNQEQIGILVSLWDSFGGKTESDRIGVQNFRQCVEPRLRKRFRKLEEESQVLPKWAKMTPAEKAANDFVKFIVRQRDRLGRFLFGRKSTFSLEHVLHLAWLQASMAELKTMKHMFLEMLRDPRRRRVRTPPLLGRDEYQELCAVFRHFDHDGAKALSFDQMVALGLVEAHSVEQTKRDWDTDNNGLLDMAEFCEMMCPLGYRASRDSIVATLEDGRRVVYDPKVGHWQLEQ